MNINDYGYAEITTPAQASVEVRKNFLKKVYGLLSLTVLSAVAGAQVGKVMPPALFFPALILYVVMVFVTMFVRHKPGWNLAALFTFTSLSGILVGPLVIVYGTAAVEQALILTFVIFGSLSGYVLVSKKDFSFLSTFLFVGLMVVLLGGVLNAFVFHSSMGEFMMGAMGVILFSGFILYDTSNILHTYSVDDHVGATLALYLDILNLFLSLLRLLSNRN